MRHSTCLAIAAALVLGGCSAKEVPVLMISDQDPAQALYEKIDAIALPVPDQSKAADETYEDEFMGVYKSAVMARGELIFELCNTYPQSKRTASLFDSHWSSIMKTSIEDGDLENYLSQIDELITDDSPTALAREKAYWIAFISSFRDKEDAAAILEHAEKFSEKFPRDQRGVTLFNFSTVAENGSVQTVTKAMVAIIEKYPSSQQVNRAKALLPLLPHVGKKFEFEFVDTITGDTVSTESLRGKVVVVDFWATWCQPCVEAIPYLIELYAEYESKGVEFVGISMDVPIDQGGLEDMRSFVAAYEVTWPQFYAGEDPALPAKYSVSSLPTMFILDQQGYIQSIDGYAVLERTIKKLLDI